MDYRGVVLAATGLCAALCLGLLLAPGAFWTLFGRDGGVAGDFAFRRSGGLFFLLTLLLFTLRDLAPGAVRTAVAGAMALGMAAMALLGLVELARGIAGPGIVVAVVAELVFALAFASVWRRERQA